ncbi:hypothetical protein [Marinobacter halotolerans]|uniref:hypothetical protein n=1 Tax=Marinobacter halotolerans TaxID=1569211 RepID=UPI00124599CA|nr:hypothetical protein [Marinobacter halotolerans]
MRADSFFRILIPAQGSMMRLATCAMLALVVAGCKTERDSEDPVILGVPPEDAYLGVEYSYNFGAVDEDDILNYSLTNAPSWLALEDITNNARQGIIMRGVPGITGGQRGRADLGVTSRINLVGNDQATAGAQPFSIDVQENQLSVVSRDYSESAPEPEENPESGQGEDDEIPDFQCAKPVTEPMGEHTYSINLYDESGNVTGSEEKTSTTRPILVQVNLDQPSVTRIRVSFELRSGFNPNRCDQGFTPDHQRCDTGLANSDEAIIGRDIVGLGSGSGGVLPTPDYVQYQSDEDGNLTRGVLTLEPGITECYVRLEVIDDLEPEKLEAFSFALTEVRSGIAGLGSSNTGVSEPLRIEDDEPTVSLQTRLGGKRDVVNLGAQTEYVAKLEGDREEEVYFAKIGPQDGSDAIQGTDFELQLETTPGAGDWVNADLITFPVGTDEVAFRVSTSPASSYNNPADNDRFVLLGLDSNYQSGRSNYAASKRDDELRVSINELAILPEVGSESGFVPTDMTMGQNGRVFIAGYDSADDNRPMVRVIDQKGSQVSEKSLYPRAVSLDAPPVIAFAARDVESGDEDVLRYEFAVSFGVEEDDAGNPTPGNVNIVTQRWFYDSALAPADYARDWQFVNGTDEDDFPRWVGITSTSGEVLVTGVTRGVFDTEDTPGGRLASFVQRIDTEPDGPLLVPELAWARQVESVSHDERVVGGGIQNTIPIVIGDSSGSVGGESQFGGKDGFFYTLQVIGEEIDVQQVGTDADESLVDGFFAAGTVWLIGNGNNNYRVVTEAGVKVLRRTATESEAGFLLGYTPAGSAMETYLANDEEDVSTETLRTAMIFNDDLVAAGSTDGVLTDDPAVQTNTLKDPALFRRNRQPRFEEDEDDDADNDDVSDKTPIIEPSQQWNRQIAIADPGIGIVEALTNYRNDEITALIKRDVTGGTVWTLNLFNPEGKPLNEPAGP